MSIYPRTNYEMTQSQLDAILDACKPTPVMKIGNYIGSSPQENANAAWDRLGREMGFDYMTVIPDHAKGDRFFTAIPSETEAQRFDRKRREDEDRRQAEIERLRSEIAAKQQRIDELEALEK